MKTCPCKECTDRHPACHGDCEIFRDWKHPLDLLQADKAKDRMIDDVLVNGRIQRIWIRSGRKKCKR